jgi:hypothetical protein
VKILKALLMGLLATLMIGCSKEPQVTIRYVDRPIEVIKPVTCKVPKVSCSIDSNISETQKLRKVAECLEELKLSTEVFNAKY